MIPQYVSKTSPKSVETSLFKVKYPLRVTTPVLTPESSVKYSYLNTPVYLYFYSRYAQSASYEPLRGKITCTYGNKAEEKQCQRLGGTKLKTGTYVL